MARSISISTKAITTGNRDFTRRPFRARRDTRDRIDHFTYDHDPAISKIRTLGPELELFKFYQFLNMETNPASPKPHILIVEDNIVNRKILTKYLTRLNHTVSIAENGVEALEYIERSEYWVGTTRGEPLSVILMDVSMPIMDGLTCTGKIREAQADGRIRGHIPIIVMTANARLEFVAEIQEAGAVSCDL